MLRKNNNVIIHNSRRCLENYLGRTIAKYDQRKKKANVEYPDGAKEYFG